MADFRIRLTTDVQKGNADEQLNAIISKLENKKIKMKFDTSDFRTQVSQLQKAMNNAFKLDPKQLSNLNTLKTTLQEINKLSKQAQKSIFGTQGSSGMKSEVVTVQNLVKQYDNLFAKQKMIERQMSKTTNAQSYAVLAKQLAQVRSQSDSVGKSLDKLGATKGSTNITNSLANSFQSVQKQIDATMTKINGLFKNKNLGRQQATELARLKQELIGLQNVNLNNIVDADKPYAEMSKLMRGASELKLAFNNLNIKIKFNDQIEKSKSSIDGLISKLQTLGKSGFSDKSGIANTLSQLQKLKSELGNINPNSSNATAQLKEMANSINQCEQEYKQLDSAMQSSKAKFKLDTNFSKTLSDLQQLRQKCIAVGQSTSQVDKLERELRQLGNVELDRASAGLQKIRSEMASVKSSMTGMNKSTTGVQRAFGNLYSTMTTFSLGNILAMQIQQGVYAIKDTIIELDSAFVRLQKVAPETFRSTKDELDDLRTKAISAGQEVARSGVDIINSTASALQAGFKDIDQAMEYAKNVNMYANVADLDEESADKYVRGIMSAYGGVENSLKPMRTQIQGASKDYSLLNSYMDNANMIGNNYALTSGDIGEALSRSASTLKSYGVSLSDSMALVAGAQESIQDASKVGNALKSLSINLGGIKTSATDGSLGLNKTAKSLEKLAGINVQKPNGELMSTMEILDELSGKWGELNQQTRVGLSEAIAGKYQSNVFNAMMDNYQTVKDIQQEIANGDAIGSAAKENARFVDSIQGRIIKLKEELKKLITMSISSDMTKGLVSGLTNVFSSINNIIGAFDKLGVATPVVTSGLAGLVMTIKSLGTGKPITNLTQAFTTIATSTSKLNSVKASLRESSTQFSTLSAGATKYSSTMTVAASSSEKFKNIMKQTTVVADTSGKKINLMTKGVAQAQKSIGGIGSSLANIGGTIATSLGNALLMAGIGVAISFAAQAWYDYAHAAEISMEKHQENISKINSKMSELKNEKSSLKSVAKEYDELAKKTNRTSEEQERYNELRNEIAEISPNLVVGTDSDNNAILSLNGSLENYIGNLDSAIKKQRELLMQQQNAEASDASDYLQKGGNVTKGYDYKNYEKATKVAEEEVGKIEKSGSKVTNAINKFVVNSESSFDKSIDRIRIARESHAEQIEQSYNKVAEEQEKIDEYGSKLRQKAINKVSSNTQIKNASDDIKSFAQTVTSSLDFSSLKSGQIDTYARSISRALGDGKIDGVLLKYQSLREELERTGDTFGYENGVKALIPEMSDLLGLNEEVVASMLKLPPTMTLASSSLDSYLQSFGKRESMRGFDAETDKLIKQYETFSGMLDDLGMLEANETVNGEVRFDVNAVADIVNREDVPKQVQDLFSQMQMDGQFTSEEMEIMMNISAGMTTEDPTQRKELLDQAQQLINQLFPDKKIDIGELDVEAEYRMNEDSKKDLADQIGKMGDEKFVATIETHVENYEQAENFSKLMSSLQGDKSDIQSFISANIEDLSKLESYEDMVQWLLENPDIANKFNISVVGVDTVDTVSKKIDELDLSKEEKKKIMVEVQEGDIPGLQGVLAELPEEKRIQVLSDIAQALGGLDTVDAIELRDKIVELLAQDGASSKINEVERKKLHDKVVKINAQDNASSVIRGLDLRTVYKYVKIVAKGTTLGVGGSRRNETQSVGNFSNISDTPQQAEMSAMSMNPQPTATPNIASSSPTGATSSVPNSYASTSSSGEMSTMATNPIDSIFTSPTNSTKISTAYNNIWNAIKYGINLFQELENRIEKVTNNIDLLSSKMQNAVGTKRISYLQQQNKLYKEQASLTNTLYKSLVKEKDALGKKAKNYGFTINSQGNLTSYEETLSKLEQASEKADKKSSDYSGKSDKTKKSLEKAADKAKTKLEEARKVSDAFLKLQNEELPSAREKWVELQNTIKDVNNEIEQLKFEQQIYKEKNAIDEINNSIKQYSHYRDRLSTKSDRYEGATKIKYMKEEAQQLKKLQGLNENLHNQYLSQRKDYTGKLKSFGAKFDSSNGQLVNYDEILNKYQNSSDLEKVKKWMEEYQDILDAERDTNDLRQEYINDMQDLQNEIKKLELEVTLNPFNTSIEISNSKIKKLQNNLDIIGIKMEYAYGDDKLNLIKEQISLYEQLQEEQKNALANMQSEEKVLQTKLQQNGFSFDDSGNITNMKNALSGIKDSESYEYISSVLEQWKSVHEDEIPDAIKSIKDYDNAIKDSYNNQLSITKEIEDKITDMLKKQIEDKKKNIEKETETIKSEIEKRKKMYQDERKEVEYKNEYNEKADNVSDLEKKLETARKDNTISNKKKIADLEKQLADAKKDLDKFVQDNLDETILNGYDKEMEAIEEKNNKAIEDLDNTWTEEKLAEAVKNALSTGLFTGIDGEVSNLQDSMLTFAETSGEALGVMGQSIKDNLIANLGIALDTLKNYSDIANGLGLSVTTPTSPNTNQASNKSITTGNISINIQAKSNADENAIAKAVQVAVEDALKGTVEGL